METYERGATYQGFLERVKEFYVGEYWIKHFDVRLGEELQNPNKIGLWGAGRQRLRALLVTIRSHRLSALELQQLHQPLELNRLDTP